MAEESENIGNDLIDLNSIELSVDGAAESPEGMGRR
jgi:hypothetical protein